MLQISQRPLTGSDADRHLFVDRSAELTRLERAAELGFNVLILGERGIGMTSLMFQHQRRLQDRGRACHYARASKSEKFVDLANLIRMSVEGRGPSFLGPENSFHVLWSGGDSDPLRGLRRLATAANESNGPPSTIILDEMHKPELAHELFGRYRDEVWELPFRWLVCGLATRSSNYLEAPADAFFDSVLRLGPLDTSACAELLKTRLDQASQNDREAAMRITLERESIIDQCQGNPRRLLEGARRTVLRTSEEFAAANKLVASAAKLGATEKLAIEYLLANGPTSASDSQLLKEWLLTRARATQVFRRLEEAGLVHAFPEKAGVGRPRKLYATSLNTGELE
ncbi:MAG: hypothetical protein OXC98_02670 [bacterium]|nr:ATP-binding protein [Acidimicrobiia bacterium]MCY4649259.1 hypothetical protein [bacterium]